MSKGFPWAKVAKVVQFTEELLKETKGMGHPGQVSERLAVGGRSTGPHCGPQPQEPSVERGASSVVFRHLVSSYARSWAPEEWSKQNTLAESFHWCSWLKISHHSKLFTQQPGGLLLGQLFTL